jgi:hypothetical protein
LKTDLIAVDQSPVRIILGRDIQDKWSDDAKRALEQVVLHNPTAAQDHNDLSVLYHNTCQFTRAIELAKVAVSILPLDASFWSNLAGALLANGSVTESIAASQRAIALNPDLAQAHLNLALALLTRGDFQRGFEEFDWGWRATWSGAGARHLGKIPIWNGEQFSGRLLLVQDQGYGDVIQSARYFSSVKALCGHLTLEAAPPILMLFGQSEWLDYLCTPSEKFAPGEVDFFLPLSGLFRIFSPTFESVIVPQPYLSVAPDYSEKWRHRLGERSGLRVGLAWAGNPNHSKDRLRSIPAEFLATLGMIPGVQWFSLQKGQDELVTSIENLAIKSFGPDVVEFSDTAAIIDQLDLVISVDTAVAHLAGAMGKRVWLLLPFVPDYRWLLERTDSIWYSSMRIFRQPQRGDWESVLADVARSLQEVA